MAEGRSLRVKCLMGCCTGKGSTLPELTFLFNQVLSQPWNTVVTVKPDVFCVTVAEQQPWAMGKCAALQRCLHSPVICKFIFVKKEKKRLFSFLACLIES